MRVVTWNMNRWQQSAGQHEAAWRWVSDELRPDVLFAQECEPPEWVARERTVIFDRAYTFNRQRWGTAIVTTLPCRRDTIPGLEEWLARLPTSFVNTKGAVELGGIQRAAGWIASANVVIPGEGEALAVSLHNPAYPIDPPRLAGVDASAVKLAKTEDIWLLDVLFHFLRPLVGSPVILGGDFNCSRLFDVPKNRGNNETFDRIAADGLVSLHRKFHDRDEQTFFAPNRGTHQLDYLYADPATAARASAAYVHPYSDVKDFSDHAPLVVDFT